MTDIDPFAAILAEVHASATTLRRRLGQRFRKLEADQQRRFNDARLEYAEAMDRLYEPGMIWDGEVLAWNRRRPR